MLYFSVLWMLMIILFSNQVHQHQQKQKISKILIIAFGIPIWRGISDWSAINQNQENRCISIRFNYFGQKWQNQRYCRRHGGCSWKYVTSFSAFPSSKIRHPQTPKGIFPADQIIKTPNLRQELPLTQNFININTINSIYKRINQILAAQILMQIAPPPTPLPPPPHPIHHHHHRHVGWKTCPLNH